MSYLKVDLIFSGEYNELILVFFEKLFSRATACNFNVPEYEIKNGFSEIREVFKNYRYIDFVLSVGEFSFGSRIVSNIFFNLSVNGTRVELLMFFDLQALILTDRNDALEFLSRWSSQFKDLYTFEYYRCQMDNGDANEYYFDSFGMGPLYAF